MATTKRVTTTLQSVNTNMNYAVLVEKSELFDWQDRKRVSDTPIGVRLGLVLPGARMTQLAVKFDHDPIPKVSDAEIAAACVSCNFLYVQIPDAVVTLYSADNGIGMTATAQTAQIVTLNNGK